MKKKHYWMYVRDWRLGGTPYFKTEGDYTDDEIAEMKRRNPLLIVFDRFSDYLYSLSK